MLLVVVGGALLGALSGSLVTIALPDLGQALGLRFDAALICGFSRGLGPIAGGSNEGVFSSMLHPRDVAREASEEPVKSE